MVDVLTENMHHSTINELTTNNKIVAIIIGESTSLVTASCLSIHLHSVVNDFPVNIFIGIHSTVFNSFPHQTTLSMSYMTIFTKFLVSNNNSGMQRATPLFKRHIDRITIYSKRNLLQALLKGYHPKKKQHVTSFSSSSLCLELFSAV